MGVSHGKLIAVVLTGLFAVSFGQSTDNSSVTSDISAEVVRDASTADIVAENSLYSRADSVDGILFTISANKKSFLSGDSLKVRYSIKNRSMGTILFDFNTACQFDLQVIDIRGTPVYSLLSSKVCLPDSSRITLPPSGEKTVAFDPVPLQLKRNDTLAVKAQMAGYPLSAVPIKVRIESTASSPPVVALEGRAGSKPVLEFNHETKMLIIHVDRAQRLTISAFILTGQKVNKLSCEKFLAPGTHLINFNSKKLSDGVVIFKVEGNGFSESKTINLSR